MSPLLKVSEAAQYARVCTDTIYDWVRAGLPASQRGVNCRYLIRHADLDAWLNGTTKRRRPKK